MLSNIFAVLLSPVLVQLDAFDQLIKLLSHCPCSQLTRQHQEERETYLWKNLGNTEIWTRAAGARSLNATAVLWRPPLQNDFVWGGWAFLSSAKRSFRPNVSAPKKVIPLFFMKIFLLFFFLNVVPQATPAQDIKRVSLIFLKKVLFVQIFILLFIPFILFMGKSDHLRSAFYKGPVS